MDSPFDDHTETQQTFVEFSILRKANEYVIFMNDYSSWIRNSVAVACAANGMNERNDKWNERRHVAQPTMTSWWGLVWSGCVLTEGINWKFIGRGCVIARIHQNPPNRHTTHRNQVDYFIENMCRFAAPAPSTISYESKMRTAIDAEPGCS